MTITNKLRNRAIGLLVILSLVMILLPAMMDPQEIYSKSDSDNTIAIDSHGVVQDQGGSQAANREVERDYSDLLAPVDDTVPAPASGSTRTAAAAAPDPAGAAPEQNDLNPFEVQYASAAAARDTAAAATAAAPAAAAAPASGRSAPAAVSTAASSRPAAAPARAAAAPEPRQETLTSRRGSAAASPAAASAGGAKFAVQVGVFSREANASSVVARLKGGGLDATTETVTINGKQMIRVYAGKTGTREAAKKLADQAQALVGTASRIVAL